MVVNDGLALAYDTEGNQVDEWTLDVPVRTSFGMGYANHQLFVFDAGRNGWQGYDLSLGGGGCTCLVKKSKAKGGCETCPEKGGDYASGADCEVVKDCEKKFKATIACPRGGNGTCKVKGKRSSCG